MVQFNSRFRQLFSQAHSTHHQIAHLLEVLLRVGGEHLNASFTAEAVLFAVVVVGDGLLPADPQPDKGAAARETN